jgi:hypothetical protein
MQTIKPRARLIRSDSAFRQNDYWLVRGGVFMSTGDTLNEALCKWYGMQRIYQSYTSKSSVGEH